MHKAARQGAEPRKLARQFEPQHKEPPHMATVQLFVHYIG